MRVGNHPDALNIDYDKPFLYCLNTNNKVIELNNLVFSDWDELINSKYQNLDNIVGDMGFDENTGIQLCNRTYCKPIKYVNIGDILENNTMVYGLVQILSNSNTNKILYHLLTTDGSLIINAVDVKDYNNLIDKFII
jgi:hypothetical protein